MSIVTISILIYLFITITWGISIMKHREVIEKHSLMFLEWYSQEQFCNVGKSSDRFHTTEDLFIKRYSKDTFVKDTSNFNYFTKQQIIEFYLKQTKL